MKCMCMFRVYREEVIVFYCVTVLQTVKEMQGQRALADAAMASKEANKLPHASPEKISKEKSASKKSENSKSSTESSK